MESDSKMFDNVKFEKEKAIARFNRLRRFMRLWQLIEVAVLFAAISWCSARSPAIVRSTGLSLSEFSTYLSNHHVVFLIGNAIIVLVLVLCRQSDAGATAGSREFYDDYVKYSSLSPPQNAKEVAPAAESSGSGDCDKQIIAARVDETANLKCDDVAEAIEKASKQIKRFERTQSETLRREISVRKGTELRRSVSVRRKEVSSEAAEIENLSSEEFRRKVDAFIDKHWSKGGPRLEGKDKYQTDDGY